jgi:multidrug efflux pump
MAGAVVISSFVALTLTASASAKILRVPESHGRVFMAFEKGFLGLSSGYSRSLTWAMKRRWYVVAGAFATVLVAVVVFRALKREFVPPEDRGFFVTFTIAPEGATLAYTDGYQRRLEEIVARTEGVEHSFSVIGFGGRVNSGIMFTKLVHWDERDRSVQEIIGEIQPQFFGVPGVLAFASNPPAFGFGNPVQFVLRNPDFDSLAVGMDRLLGRARGINGLINIDTDLRINKPELTVSYDRDRAEDLGVQIRDVSATLQTLLGGRRVSTFTRANKLYDVMVQLEPQDRATPGDMAGLYVRGRDGSVIKLDAVARIQEGVGPRQLNHFSRVRSATLTGNLAPGFTLGEALDSLNAAAAQVLPLGTSIALAGESRELEESGNALYFAFVLALVVVFMVLAAQFESLIHPFTVLLSVPLAVTGALLTLLVAGSTLNLYSQIGMILLIGLVSKNAILLVEYANQLKAKGMASMEAMLESARIRLRPILMTATATVIGASPIALGLGAGSLSRRPLGYAIVGGLLFSTVLTLFLVPVVWVMLDELQVRLRRRAPALEPAEAAR